MTSKRSNAPRLACAAAIVTYCAVFAATVNASGSVSPGGAQATGYQLGKSVFHRKLTCAGCVFEGRGKSADDARKLIGELDGASTLTQREREAVVIYLTKLHRLG